MSEETTLPKPASPVPSKNGEGLTETPCSTQPRYVTFVFDREYDSHPMSIVLPRNMLGEDYQNATPVIWAQGDRMDRLEGVLQILRDIREGDIDDPQSYVEKWFNEGEGKTECYY